MLYSFRFFSHLAILSLRTTNLFAEIEVQPNAWSQSRQRVIPTHGNVSTTTTPSDTRIKPEQHISRLNSGPSDSEFQETPVAHLN